MTDPSFYFQSSFQKTKRDLFSSESDTDSKTSGKRTFFLNICKVLFYYKNRSGKFPGPVFVSNIIYRICHSSFYQSVAAFH